MSSFRLIYRRLYGVIQNNLGLSNYKKVSLDNILYNKRNVLIIGLIPIIPSISAQSLNIKEEKDDSLSNPNTINNEEDNKYYGSDDDKTPWERVRAIYETDEYGNWSKEMTVTVEACYLSIVVGFIYGGVQKSRVAFVDFMERNQATLFENHLDAKRKLQNHVTIHFGKGAFQWAWRLTAFTGGFMLMFSSFHAYRGTTSYVDYAASGAIVGAVMRVKLGPRGIIVGGVLGGVLGFFSGLANHTMLHLYGVSYDDVLEQQYKFDRKRALLVEKQHVKRFEESGTVPKAAIDMLKSHDTQE